MMLEKALRSWNKYYFLIIINYIQQRNDIIIFMFKISISFLLVLFKTFNYLQYKCYWILLFLKKVLKLLISKYFKIFFLKEINIYHYKTLNYLFLNYLIYLLVIIKSILTIKEFILQFNFIYISLSWLFNIYFILYIWKYIYQLYVV